MTFARAKGLWWDPQGVVVGLTHHEARTNWRKVGRVHVEIRRALERRSELRPTCTAVLEDDAHGLPRLSLHMQTAQDLRRRRDGTPVLEGSGCQYRVIMYNGAY